MVNQMEQQNKPYVTREEFNKLEERVSKLEITSAVNVYQYEDIKKTLGVIQKDVETIKSIPNKRQESAISTVITAIVSAIIGGILALIMK